MQQLGVVGDEHQLGSTTGQLDGTDDRVAGLEPDRPPRTSLLSTSGLTRLTTPCAVPSASPRESGERRGQAEHPLVAFQRDQLRQVRAALKVRRVGRRRHRRQVERVDPDQPARGLVSRPRSPRAVAAHPGDQHVVVGARAAGRQRVGVVGPGQQAGRGQQHPARDRRRSPSGAARPCRRRPRWRPAGWCAAGCRGCGRPRPARCRPARAAASGRRGSVAGSAISLCSRSRSASSSIRENRVSRRSCMSKMYVAWVSVSSNTSISRARAAATSSELRMIAITSSMSTIAISRPSTRCSRSLALRSRNSVRRAGDLQPVVEVDAQQLAEGQRTGLAVDEGHGVDGERVLHLGQPIQLFEQGVRVEAVLDLDHQPGAVGQVGQVLDVGDALELAVTGRGS